MIIRDGTLASSQVFARIRNVQLRLFPENELFAYELAKYDQKVVLEALHNCIVHQDYALSARVVVIERPDRLILESEGGFLRGSPRIMCFVSVCPVVIAARFWPRP